MEKDLLGNNTFMKKVNLQFFIITSISLFLFDLYKASHSSFTYDESFSYTHYAHLSIWDIFTNVDPAEFI